MRRVVFALVAAALGASALVGPVQPAGAVQTPTLPNDPRQKGFIGFCDRNNKNVSGGNLTDTPMVWKAVASTPPPSSVLGRGQNAILNIYQPRPNTTPDLWSGDQLTGASFYDQSAAPTVQATLKDLSLADIVAEYPPMVDGLYQLRMYFGKLNQQLYSSTYPATVIRVAGNKWSVVSGGEVNCAATSAQSLETLSGVVSLKDAYGSKPLPKASGTPSAKATVAPSGSSGGNSSQGAGSGNAASQNSAGSHHGGKSAAPLWIGIGALVVLAVGAIAFAFGRRTST